MTHATKKVAPELLGKYNEQKEPNPTVLKAMSSLVKGSSVVIAGFSSSTELIYLLKSHFIARGIESSEEIVNICGREIKSQKLPHYALINARFENQTVLKRGSLDGVIAHNNLTSPEDKDIQEWVKMADNVLRVGGKIFIGSSSNLWTKEQYLNHFSSYFKDFTFEGYSEPDSLDPNIERDILVMSATKK